MRDHLFIYLQIVPTAGYKISDGLQAELAPYALDEWDVELDLDDICDRLVAEKVPFKIYGERPDEQYNAGKFVRRWSTQGKDWIEHRCREWNEVVISADELSASTGIRFRESSDPLGTISREDADKIVAAVLEGLEICPA